MHALLLTLALGQAGPATPALARSPAPGVAAAGAATPPGRATGGSPPREVEVVRLPDGGFRATLDGQPVTGAGFYRAVLRPDLAVRLEDARHRRTLLWLAAGLAPAVGAGIGWVAGDAQHRTVGCDEPAPPITSATGLAECARVRRENRATVGRAVAAGAAGGLAVGALLWLAGRAVALPEPSAAEAEALARSYRAGVEQAPAPGTGRPPGASLRLEAGHQAARLALRVEF